VPSFPRDYQKHSHFSNFSEERRQEISQMIFSVIPYRKGESVIEVQVKIVVILCPYYRGGEESNLHVHTGTRT